MTAIDRVTSPATSMDALPHGWERVRLGDVLVPVSRAVDVTASHVYPLLGMHWYAQGLYIKDRKPGASIQAQTLFQVAEGDFVYNRLFAWKGSFGLVEKDVAGCFVSNEFPSFRVAESRVDSQYLLRYFSQKWLWESIEGKSSGSTPTSRLRLKESQLLAMHLPLPPLDEQRRIVARIEAFAARIAEARGLRREAGAEAEGLARSEFDVAYDKVSSAGSPTVTVEDVEVLVTSGPRNFSSRYDDAGSLRFYRAQDITSDGQIATSGVVFVDPPEDMTTRAIVEHGDVLVVITGATIGRSAVVSPEHPRGLVSQHVGLVRVDPQRLNPDYLHYAILAPAWAGGQLNKLRYGQGKPGLNLANLRALEVPLPSLEEQARVVAHLDTVSTSAQELKRQQVESAAELDALLPSVLDRAFRGEL